MKKFTTVQDIVGYLMRTLNVGQGLLGDNYLAMHHSLITKNWNKSGTTANREVFDRLHNLYMVVCFFKNGYKLNHVIMKEALNEFVYEDLDGNVDSVVSALVQDKYDVPTLINIGKIGLQQYELKLKQRIEHEAR